MRDGPLEVGGRTIDVSSTDKVFFPEAGVTKGDLVAYYRDVAEVMVAHVAGRPLTLQRFPDGISGEGFYQKAASGHFPEWIRTVTVRRRGKQDTIEQVVADDHAAVVYLADQGTVTFHVWPSRVGDLERPDIVVFDLDPPDGHEDVGVLRAGARLLRDVLEDLGLVPFVQTSGSRGFHVAAPIDVGPDFEVVRQATRAIADHAASLDPERFTTAQRKAKRAGRIFIDTNRNAYAQHYVAPYAVRPREGAPIATPIDWDELGRVEPRSYTVTNIRRRLGQKHDPWADMHEHAVDFSAVMERATEMA